MVVERLQTLERGLDALTLVAGSDEGLSVGRIAAELCVHRAIAYRIVGTLEARSMVHRLPGGRVVLGGGALALAARSDLHLRSRARPLLERLAGACGATAFLSVAQGEDCVAILTVEDDRAFLKVGYRPGSRHPLTRGAAGLAILAARPERSDDSEPVRAARRGGCSVTRGELQRGAVGVASSVPVPDDRLGGIECSVGVVAMDDLDVERARGATIACATELASLMVGGAGLARGRRRDD